MLHTRNHQYCADLYEAARQHISSCAKSKQTLNIPAHHHRPVLTPTAGKTLHIRRVQRGGVGKYIGLVSHQYSQGSPVPASHRSAGDLRPYRQAASHGARLARGDRVRSRFLKIMAAQSHSSNDNGFVCRLDAETHET